MSFNDKDNMNNIKKNLTLDFNQVKKSLALPNNNGLLMSPDLSMLNVDTPELEKMILATNSTSTPTPNAIVFPKPITTEQESFVGGFEEALNKLHYSDSNSTAFNDPQVILPLIKEEPQTVPNIQNSPPMSPVDMAYQERIKLERKRQRNRLAASKCRSRKLERISKLEDKVKLLKGENNELGSLVNQLKEHVGLLKLEVMDHHNAGCQVFINQY